MGAFFAVAEEEVAAAGGTDIADEDIVSGEAGTEELGTIGFAEVEEDVLRRGLVAGGHHVEPLDWIGLVAGAEFVEPLGGFGELREELGGDFGADFVAAASNGGADGGEEVGRVALELHLHLADGFDEDAGEGASPAGVDGGDGALFRVNKENGDAVGGLDGEEEGGAVGDGRVSLAGFGGRSVEKMDYVGMDLFQGDELEGGGAEGGLEAAAVFEDIFLGVPFGETEIEDFFGTLSGVAAGLGAEAVDEPGDVSERGHLQDSDATRFAFDPLSTGSGERDRQECLSHRGKFAVLWFGLQCFRGRHNLPSINRRGTRVFNECETQYDCRTRFGAAALRVSGQASCRTPSGGGN